VPVSVSILPLLLQFFDYILELFQQVWYILELFQQVWYILELFQQVWYILVFLLFKSTSCILLMLIHYDCQFPLISKFSELLSELLTNQ
jgi:hypothetical protein